MSHTVFRAELSTAVGGIVGILETSGPNGLVMLRKQIAREWVPILEDGDSIRIFETYEDR